MNNLSVVESIFFAALEKPSLEDRAAYLEQVCGPDQELRRCVERLLSAHPKVGSFLQAPASPLPATTAETSISEGPGQVIGPYKLREQIGEGGMGLVFVADQQYPVCIPAEWKHLPATALERVVQLYQAWDKPEHAARWRKECDAMRQGK
jgi:hypothetical protein